MRKLTLLLLICTLPLGAMENAHKQDGAVYLLAKSKHTDLKIETMTHYFISQINKAETLVDLDKVCAQFMPLYLDCLSVGKHQNLERIHKEFEEKEDGIVTDIAMQLRLYDYDVTFHGLKKGINHKYPQNECTVLEHFIKPGYSIKPYLIELLIKNGAKVNSPRDASTNTPLHRACIGGRIGIAQLLLRAGAQVNRQNKNLETPLHFAARSNNGEKLIELLIANNADVHAQNKYGKCALHEAARGGLTKNIALLIEKGSQVNALDNFMGTPLHSAMYPFSTDHDIMLLKAGTNINAQNKQGQTPLYLAAALNAQEHIKILLDNGADRTIVDKNGWDARDIAYKNGHLDTAKLLKEYNCAK